MRPALRENEHAVSAVDRTSDYLLRTPPAVEGRGVDPVDPDVERSMDGANSVALILRAPVHPPGSGRGADRRRPNPDRRDRKIAFSEASHLHEQPQRVDTQVYAGRLRSPPFTTESDRIPQDLGR